MPRRAMRRASPSASRSAGQDPAPVKRGVVYNRTTGERRAPDDRSRSPTRRQALLTAKGKGKGKGKGEDGVPQNPVCVYFLVGRCNKPVCDRWHPAPTQRKEILAWMRTTPCRNGSACWRQFCAFYHPGREPEPVVETDEDQDQDQDRSRERSASPSSSSSSSAQREGDSANVGSTEPRHACVFHVMGSCGRRNCPKWHPTVEQCAQLRMKMKSTPCHYGKDCQRVNCAFMHEGRDDKQEEEQHQGSGQEDERSPSPSHSPCSSRPGIEDGGDDSDLEPHEAEPVEPGDVDGVSDIS